MGSQRGAQLRAAVEEVLPDLKREGVRVFYLNSASPTPGVEALLPAIEAASDEPLPEQHRANTTADSKAIYIYTSGTTGLPKAAVITEMKVMMVANLARICGLRSNDVVYTTLPLYHSAGLLIGVGGCFETFASFELIKYNVEEDEPVRDKEGFCIRARPGETGLLVVKITSRTPFHGYAGDSQKTEKKILRDVFAKGDAFFNSGDLLMMDRDQFLYFQDRVGDTFRWKGENVATTEVEATLAMVDFIQEVNVYGVTVPGCEGRCGMAAVRLKPDQSFDGESLYAFTRDTLPAYAAPRFVRVQDVLEITGTFKQCKGNLVQEGFDPNVVTDPLYFRDDKKKSYVPMNSDIYAKILDGSLSL
ncbi:UNVERIFIED_CONTAM: hypothetical protein H355_013040 [Colinus virginianus]|nr:hypothetical protein H355_013040 [Colinus virginianus]